MSGRAAVAGVVVVLLFLTGFASLTVIRNEQRIEDVGNASDAAMAFVAAQRALQEEELLLHQVRREGDPAAALEAVAPREIAVFARLPRTGPRGEPTYILRARHLALLRSTKSALAAHAAGDRARAARIQERVVDASSLSIRRDLNTFVAESNDIITERTRSFEKANERVTIPFAFALGLALLGFFITMLMGDQRRGAERRKKEQLEEQARRSQRLEAIGQLAGGVAHDFNNILAVIINYADFVRDELPEGRLRQDVDEIRHASARGAALARQLLVFSRKELVQPEILDLNSIVVAMDRLLRPTLGEQIRLVASLSDQPALVEADRPQLEQVLANLVVNGRDAMPAGGVLRIETETVELERAAADAVGLAPGRFVRLLVTDEGDGIEDSVAERAFEPFFTTKPRGQGTGLGLSTVYGIVIEAGGHIELRSATGAGTVATVLFPAADGQPAEQSHDPGPVAVPETGDGTVLLAEDDDSLREITARTLEKAGYRVLSARNGSEAIELFSTHEGLVDVLLTDVVLPGMSGKELAERLDREDPSPAVVYMSGYTDDAMPNHGFHREAVAFLSKPFTAQTLLRVVSEATSARIGSPAGFPS